METKDSLLGNQSPSSLSFAQDEITNEVLKRRRKKRMLDQGVQVEVESDEDRKRSQLFPGFLGR